MPLGSMTRRERGGPKGPLVSCLYSANCRRCAALRIMVGLTHQHGRHEARVHLEDVITNDSRPQASHTSPKVPMTQEALTWCACDTPAAEPRLRWQM
jgi:hypothetical protein